MDDTYARNRTQDKGNLYRLDKKIFDDEANTREDHAQKIMERIKNK